MAAAVAVPQMLVAYAFTLSKPKQVILVGEKSAHDLAELTRVLHARFVPDKVVLLLNGDEARKTITGYLPVAETMVKVGGKATAYVCENYTCKLPTSDPAKFAELLQ